MSDCGVPPACNCTRDETGLLGVLDIFFYDYIAL